MFIKNKFNLYKSKFEGYIISLFIADFGKKMSDEKAAFLDALKKADKYPSIYWIEAGVIIVYGGVVDFRNRPTWFSQVESVTYSKKESALILNFGDQTARLEIIINYDFKSWKSIDGDLISAYYCDFEDSIKLYRDGYIILDLFANRYFTKHKNTPYEELYDKRFIRVPRIPYDFSKTLPSKHYDYLMQNFKPVKNYNPAPSITIMTNGEYNFIAKLSKCKLINETPFNFQNVETGAKYMLYTPIRYNHQIYCVNEHEFIEFISVSRYYVTKMTGIFTGCVPVTPTNNQLLIIGDVILEEFKSGNSKKYEQCPVHKPSSGSITKAALRSTELDDE